MTLPEYVKKIWNEWKHEGIANVLEQIIFFSQVPMPTSIKKRKMFENQYKTSLVYKIFIQLLLFQQAYAHNDNGDIGNNNSKINTST